MGKLEPGGIRDGGDELQVGQQAYPVSPGVWRELKASGFRERSYLANLINAFRKDRIRLENVVAPAIDQKLELVYPVVVLAAGQS